MFGLFAVFALMGSEPQQNCAWDREAVLEMDAVAFDQIEGQGWRPLYDARCYIEAAEMLRYWQAHNGASLSAENPREASLLRILKWHEAQMWGFAERNDLALPMFERSYAKDGQAGWNLYVTGTIAFLRRDRQALEAAIAHLSALPEPAGWGRAVGQDGKPISFPWPPNLDVLEGLNRCWDKPYVQAYLCRDISRAR